MARPAVLFAAAILVPLALIGWRVSAEARALHGPAGGSGTVEGTTLTLSSKVAARVTSLEVKEGDAVKAGDLLVRLDCADTQAQLAEANARVEAARAQAAAARAQAAAAGKSEHIASATSDVALRQASALRTQQEAAARQAARLDRLSADVAAQSVDQSGAAAAALEHQEDAARAQARVGTLQADAARAQADAAGLQADAADKSVTAAESSLQRLNLLVAECDIRAPRDGLIETLPFDPGELVPPGGPLATLVDLTDVKATFWLPNAEIGKVEPGAEARVQADAWPDETFTGKVTTVGLRAEFTPRNIQTRTDRDRLVYAIEVTVPNPDGRLKPGMPVQVTLPGTELP